MAFKIASTTAPKNAVDQFFILKLGKTAAQNLKITPLMMIINKPRVMIFRGNVSKTNIGLIKKFAKPMTTEITSADKKPPT